MPALQISNPLDLRAQMRIFRNEGKRIALVPTMGFLHEGHRSLLRKARKNCDVLVMSLFVNPKQFAPGEDLERYPRDAAGDQAKAEECGVDLIFTPSVEDMYPTGFQTEISLPKLSAGLCGLGRPHHFGGVATVVTKLFNLCLPHAAYFGQKDAQQLAIIRQLVIDLALDVEIFAGAIVREEDGLAMSSRNVYLSEEERGQARNLYLGLQAAKQRFDEGANDRKTLLGAAQAIIESAPLAQLEYIELCDTKSLLPVEEVQSDCLIALAAKFGKTRLIDNILLPEKSLA